MGGPRRYLVVAAMLAGLAVSAGCGAGEPGPSGPAPSSGISTPPASGPAVPAPRGAWTYAVEPSPDGEVRTATVTGPDGRLVFSRNPVWGSRAVLELPRPEIACPTGCRFEVQVDGALQPPWLVSVRDRPGASASFRDQDRLWTLVTGARSVVIGYPRGTSATGTATFDTTGGDRGALPGS